MIGIARGPAAQTEESALMQYYRQTTLLWFLGVAAASLGPAPPSAYAQPESMTGWSTKGYADPIKPDTTVKFGNMSEVFRTGQWVDPTNDPQQFADLYEKRLFRKITDLKTRGNPKDDPVIVLRSHIGRLAKFPGSPVFDKLVDVTLDYMQPIATDAKWHPAVRESAILAIGEVKSPKAVDALLELLKTKDLHPMFKVAAMAGLVHLAEQGVMAPPPVAAPVVALMVSCANAKPNSPPDYLRWMRGQAADVLGAIGSVGNGEVPAALLTIVADKDLPLAQRGKAARALGRLDYSGGLPDAQKFVQPLTEFGSDALAENLPCDARRIRTVARAFLGDPAGASGGKKDAGALGPLLEQSNVPKVVQQMRAAMDELLVATTVKPGPIVPSEEKIKPAVVKARAVFDAAAGKK
jgi:hypothetical protein